MFFLVEKSMVENRGSIDLTVRVMFFAGVEFLINFNCSEQNGEFHSD